MTDEYSLFYLQFINTNKNAGRNIWQKLSQSQKYKSWAGFAFEGIILKHIHKIKEALGITGIYTNHSSFIQQGNNSEDGFQIDLIIDRADNAINIFEIKYYQSEISLSKAESETLRLRREAFRQSTKTNKYLFNTLITTYGLIPNERSIGLIDNVITMEKLF